MPRALAISLARSVTIHDSLYLALAEQRHIQLVTADKRLVNRMSGDARLEKLIIWIGEFSPHADGSD